MVTQVHGEVPGVPRLVTVFLNDVFIILLVIGVLCSFVASCYFLWKFFRNRVFGVPSTLSTEASSDKETEGDEDLSEESDSSVYFEDTDEEYIRGTF